MKEKPEKTQDSAVLDRYVVIGNPVAHSRSPEIHQLFAQQTGQKLSYDLLQAPLDGFATAADEFFAAGGAGANVTVPFKQAAARWVNRLDPAAEFAGAVNTIVRVSAAAMASSAAAMASSAAAMASSAAAMASSPDEYAGFNTDGPGLIADLKRGLADRSLKDARILILGAGGAVRGVLAPLAEQAPATLVIANRTAAKALQLAGDLTLRYPDLDVLGVNLSAPDRGFDVVINATSAGLDGAVAPIDERCVRGAFCYDMVYGARTAFCDWASSRGAAATRDGLGMLVEQAAQAFYLWRGVMPDVAAVLEHLRKDIERV